MCWRQAEMHDGVGDRANLQRNAYDASVSIWDQRVDRDVVKGSPHLKHASLQAMMLQLMKRVEAMVEHTGRPLEVLDLGSGAGLASIPWLQAGAALTAVDGSSVSLGRLASRSRAFGVPAQTIVSDALDFVLRGTQEFDVVSCVSMLHHIPDYGQLVTHAVERVRPGGALFTFMDPLRYDSLPRWQHVASRAAYFTWRLGGGNYVQGAKTRWRRIRGVYSATEPGDNDEYHVQRNGVDSNALRDALVNSFDNVTVIPFWGTQSGVFQRLGEYFGWQNSFAIVATGRHQS